MTLRCGRIKYTNDLPIYAAFDAGAIAYPGTLHADVPARLNAMLLAGDLDLSPISRIYVGGELAASSCCCPISASARATKSSRSCSSRRCRPRRSTARPVYVTEESASGRNLLRVLLERRYGVRPRYCRRTRSDCSAPRGGDPTLLIGDRRSMRSNASRRARLRSRTPVARVDRPADGLCRLGGAPRRLRARSRGNRAAACTRSPIRIRGRARTSTDVVALAQRAIARPAGFYEALLR